MALQFAAAVRNAELDAIETAVGTSPRLRGYTGSAPGVANAATGTLLFTAVLPSDWMNAASGGTKTKLGTWQDGGAAASGTPGYFRIWDSGLAGGLIEGSAAVGSGDLNFDNTVSLGGIITITTFTLTCGNA